MRHALILASILLCCGCGDDDEDGTGDAGEGGGDEGVTWHCTCWTERDDGTRTEEEFVRCSATDPTEMYTDRVSAAAEDRGFTGGCDPCEDSDEDCVLED